MLREIKREEVDIDKESLRGTQFGKTMLLVSRHNYAIDAQNGD